MRIYRIYESSWSNGYKPSIVEAEARETNKFYITEGPRPGLEWGCTNRHDKNKVSLSREDAIDRYIEKMTHKEHNLLDEVNATRANIQEAEKLRE